MPFIKFFVRDWMGDERLRLCSPAARGFWMDLLCLMHSAPRRGFLQTASGLPLPIEQIARATGCTASEAAKLMQELIDAGVPEQTGEGIVFSRRMSREEEKRERCSQAGSKGGGNPALADTFKGQAKGGAKGDPKGQAKGGAKLNPNPSEAQTHRGSEAQSHRAADTHIAAAVAEVEFEESRVCDPIGLAPDDPERPPRLSVFVEAWNAVGLLPTGETSNRRGWWQQRWADPWFRENWRDAVGRAGLSARCRGEVNEWRATADWFLKDSDAARRILEGEFDSRAPPAKPDKVTEGMAVAKRLLAQAGG